MTFQDVNPKTGLSSTYVSKLKAKDKRLRILVSRDSNNETTINKLLIAHSNLINAKFRTSGELMGLWMLNAFYKKVPAYEIMDAIGALTHCQWRRLKRSYSNNIDYEADSYVGFYEESRSNKPPGRKVRNEKAADFIKFIDSLPDDVRNQVINGVPFKMSELPEQAKKSLRSTLQSVYDFAAGDDPDIPKKDFSKTEKAKMTIKTNNSSDKTAQYSEYGIQVELEVGQLFFTVDNYETKKLELAKLGRNINSEEEKVHTASYYLDYHVEKDFVVRKKAIQLAVMNQPVSMSMRNADMTKLLRYLSERYEINSVYDTPVGTPAKDIDIPTLPLWKVLDIACEQLGKWQWECRSTGMLILRAPTNPYRRSEP